MIFLAYICMIHKDLNVTYAVNIIMIISSTEIKRKKIEEYHAKINLISVPVMFLYFWSDVWGSRYHDYKIYPSVVSKCSSYPTGWEGSHKEAKTASEPWSQGIRLEWDCMWKGSGSMTRDIVSGKVRDIFPVSTYC